MARATLWRAEAVVTAMRMAKASQADIDAAYALCNAFETLRHGFDPCVEDGGPIACDDPNTCVRVLAHLRELAGRGSLSRVLGGLVTLLDPRNEIVDPTKDYLDLHPRFGALVEQKDGAYCERDRLVCALSKVFPAWLARHPNDQAWEDDWRWIVFVQLPTGQASWHIHDSERAWFNHLQVGGAAWDGHSTDEKYRRVDALAPGGGA